MHGYFLRPRFRKRPKSDCDINGRKKKSETEKERKEAREGGREAGLSLEEKGETFFSQPADFSTGALGQCEEV